MAEASTLDSVARRLADLEDLVKSQGDELVVLRTALANVTRRLSACEEKQEDSAGRPRAQASTPATLQTSGGQAHGRGSPRTPTPSAGTSVKRRTLPVPGQVRSANTSSLLGGRPPSPSPSRKVASKDTVAGRPPRPSSSSGREAATSTDSHGSLQRQGSWRGSGRGAKLRSPSPAPPTAAIPTGHAEADRDNRTIKIYLRGRALTLFAPSGYDMSTVQWPAKKPAEQLVLEWVYGYRGRDCRQNLFVLPSGELLYFIAAVAVIYNRVTAVQRHYTEHVDDIKSMAVHPSQKIAATGQVAGHDKDGGKPHVRVWDVDTLQTLAVIGTGDFDRGIAVLAFSHKGNGAYLMAVAEDNDHTLTLWDWRAQRKLAESRTHSDAVLCGAFTPTDELSLITCGKQHIFFWKLADGKLSKKSGIFEKHAKPKFITCMAFTVSHDLVTGDTNGNISVWSAGSNRISQVLTGAHDGGVFCLLPLEDGGMLSGGGRDRKIIAWNQAFRQTGDEYELPETAGPIRMLTMGAPAEEDGSDVEGPLLFVGTTRNCILEGTLATGFKEIIKGHADELWGLAVHPFKDRFVTAGYDKTVSVWDVASHDVIWTSPLSDEAQSADVHPRGSVIVVGMRTGRWIAFDSENGTYVKSCVAGAEQLDCVKFSPDGSMMAVGSHDNHIYLYTVSDDVQSFERIGRCSGHSSFVTHLDWSTDSQYLQSSSGDYELLFWHASTCKQETSQMAMRDIAWHTFTCTLGFPVSGIWPEGADGTDINTACRNNAASLLATGDDFGKVNLFRYPVPQEKSECFTGRGHSSHVTGVAFLHDDSLLISTGGKDTSIMQWTVIQPDTV